MVLSALSVAIGLLLGWNAYSALESFALSGVTVLCVLLGASYGIRRLKTA